MLKMMFKKGQGWIRVKDIEEAKKILEENSKKDYFTFCFYTYPKKQTKLKIIKKVNGRIKEYELNEIVGGEGNEN